MEEWEWHAMDDVDFEEEDLSDVQNVRQVSGTPIFEVENEPAASKIHLNIRQMPK